MGMIAMIRMTAMSWKRRTEKLAWPPRVCSTPFSASDCKTMAVDDIATIRPIAIA
jgi:hypothetical protein